MQAELTVLALAGVLQGVQYIAFAVCANRQIGPKIAMSPRDEAHSLTGRTGRSHALNNHFEGLIMFTLAVVVVTLGHQGTNFTAACAWLYLLARILYVPAYVLGWVPWRSIIWMIGFGATMLMILAALL